MDGGDRSGYKQISKSVDAVYIDTTKGKCSATEQWVDFQVISSSVRIKNLTAPGLKNASDIDTDEIFYQDAIFECSKITMIELSTIIAAGKVIAHSRVLL